MAIPLAQLDLASLRPPLPVGDGDRGQDLGQEEFFALMLTQLKNQDPFKPLDSGEFLGQIAQFSAVQGIADLNSSFTSLSDAMVSNQALQGAALVGRSVLTPSNVGLLPAGGAVTGAVELPTDTSALRVEIQDATGQIVRQIDLGAQPAGLARFRWGGESDFGTMLPPGTYTVAARYFSGTGMQAAQVLSNFVVDSVSVTPQGLTVHIDGIGAVAFSAIREIG